MKAFVILAAVFCMIPSRANPPLEPPAATPVCASAGWTVDRLGDEARIFYQAGSESLQYGALHLQDSYFRLNYGAGSGWGPSVILMPAFWSGGHYHQGARVSLACRFSSGQLLLVLRGTISTLSVTLKVRLEPPAARAIRARVTAYVQGDVVIDARPGEAFKPVTLSSMRISASQWDSKRACAGTRCFAIPARGWIVPPAQKISSTEFRLIGGTSAWKTNSPTIVIKELSSPRRITGWVTPSGDPNDDNVGFWAAAGKVLRSWSYTIVARRP